MTAEARKSIEHFTLLRDVHGRLYLDPEPREGEQYIRLADVEPLVEAVRELKAAHDDRILTLDADAGAEQFLDALEKIELRYADALAAVFDGLQPFNHSEEN